MYCNLLGIYTGFPISSPAPLSIPLLPLLRNSLSALLLGPTGTAKSGEDCTTGAGEGTLAPGGPVGEGAAGKGEPEDRRPGSAARRSARGKPKLSSSCGLHTSTEP